MDRGVWWATVQKQRIGHDKVTKNNKDLLFHTENSVQQSAMTSMGKASDKEGVYVRAEMIHPAVRQELAEQWESAILQ